MLAMSHNVAVVMMCLWSKSKAKPKSAVDMHPFRKKKRDGLKLRPDNIGVLKSLGRMFCKS